MKIESWPRIFSWPMYSSSSFGRSARSKASSWGEAGAAVMRRSVSIMRIMASLLREQFASSSSGQYFQRLAYAFRHTQTRLQIFHRVLRFLVAVAEREQRVHDVAAGALVVGADFDDGDVELIF